MTYDSIEQNYFERSPLSSWNSPGVLFPPIFMFSFSRKRTLGWTTRPRDLADQTKWVVKSFLQKQFWTSEFWRTATHRANLSVSRASSLKSSLSLAKNMDLMYVRNARWARSLSSASFANISHNGFWILVKRLSLILKLEQRNRASLDNHVLHASEFPNR